MPETNSGTPQTAVADTPKAGGAPESLIGDFAEALANYGNPVPEAGHSKEAQASESKEAETPPAKAEDTKESKADEGKAETQPKAPDFSRLPDSIRSTFEQLHKAGHVAADVIDEVGKGYLRQSDYTKKRMADAEAKRVFEEEKAKQAERLAALESILTDPRKAKAFQAALAAQDEAEPEIDITKDPKDVAADVRGIVKGELTAAQKAEQAQREAEDKAEAGLKSAAGEWYDTVKDTLTDKEGNALLDAVTAEWNARMKVDPTFQPLRDVKPADLTRRLSELAEVHIAKRETAEAKKQLEKRQADAARSAKASSGSQVRVVPTPDFDLRTPEGRLKKSMQDLGLDDWSQVPFGNRGPEQAV